MKCFATIALLACVSLARAEPPVPQNQYLPPNQGGQPSNQYLPPTQSYQSPSNNYLPPQRGGGAGVAPPSSSYGAPAAGAPSSQYGAPALTGAIFPKQQGGSGGGYGSGSGNGGYGGEEQYGPAKYEFKYDVQDYESGNDFGHMEQRDGDLAVGRYYVLLPDGRKQIVDYEADGHGYRPTIRYEQVNNGFNGNGAAGGRGGQGGQFAGYQ
ncbi:pro-resilin [Anastrepha obliqua]|uniref:pro-resilin n=1 Tax=Anastrepha ludens TaxID=28586 RepID=UPI0023B17A84|nr:pro-resilin [Anastrepha ludens]XP_054740244.1 pro-resilin [Anastrepha obliqua]